MLTTQTLNMNTKDRVNSMKWKVTSHIMGKIIECGGKVFGGAVRDSIIHNVAAEKFYEIPCNNYSYDDKTAHTHLSGRFVIPKDIDAVIHTSLFKPLIDELKKMYTITTSTGDSVEYFFDEEDEASDAPNTPLSEMTHHRMVLTPINKTDLKIFLKKMIPVELWGDLCTDVMDAINTVHTPSIKIDLFEVRVANVEPPFGHLDFECNGLVMDKHGVRLSNILVEEAIHYAHRYNPAKTMGMLSRIVSDINNMRAVPVAKDGSTAEHRYKKMHLEGWAIVREFDEFEVVTEDYSGHCIICMCSVPSNHYKAMCCDARYHEGCLRQALTIGSAAMTVTTECIMCRTHIPGASDDLRVLTSHMNRCAILPMPVPILAWEVPPNRI